MQFLVLELVVQTVMGLLRWLLLVVRALPYLAGRLVRIFRTVWRIDVEIFRRVREQMREQEVRAKARRQTGGVTSDGGADGSQG